MAKMEKDWYLTIVINLVYNTDLNTYDARMIIGGNLLKRKLPLRILNFMNHYEKMTARYNFMTDLIKQYYCWLESPDKMRFHRTNNIDGAEPVRVAHNAILVSGMHLATIALLCKQITDNFRTRHPPEPRWRHLSGNRILFVPH